MAKLTDTEWSEVLLIATPRIASGKVEALSQSSRQAAGRFSLVLLAETKAFQNAQGQREFQLAQVGIGYAVPDEAGALVTLTSQSAKSQRVSLDMLSSRILAENEKQIQQLQVIAADASHLLFDANAIRSTEQGHREARIRHLIWVDVQSGALGMLVWSLSQNQQTWVTDPSPFRWIPPRTHEDRRIHVDGAEFFLGIPNRLAFAIENLTPGTEYAWHDSVASIACRATYQAEQLDELIRGLSELLKTPYKR